MAVDAAGPETMGNLSDAPQGADPGSKKSRSISGKSPMRIAMSRLRRDKIAMACVVVIIFFALVAVFAGLICKVFGVNTDYPLPSQFLDLSGIPRNGPPNNGFDPEHPFGIAPRTATDNLAFWVYGARNSLQIATLATIVSAVVGITLGLVAGFAGGVVDKVISFFIDTFLTLPYLLMALSIAPILNQRFATSPNYGNIQVIGLLIVLSLFGWMGVARLIRGEVLSLREREFVQAARVIGMPTRRILVKELLPNLAAPIVVSVSLMLPTFISAEAGLAYLGIGVTSRPSWGQTIDQGTRFFESYPLYMLQPMIGIVLLVLALNLLGDALRDALDPKTRR
jgi:peptide/nickel transport system permease protein